MVTVTTEVVTVADMVNAVMEAGEVVTTIVTMVVMIAAEMIVVEIVSIAETVVVVMMVTREEAAMNVCVFYLYKM